MSEWIRATWLGWLLGIVLTVAAALALETIGLGGSQTGVGLGMGLGVSFMQARALRGVLDDRRAWIVSTTVGLATPFLAYDILNAAGLGLPFSLAVCVGVGGVVVGIWQATLLRSTVRDPRLWIASTIVGWSLAGGCALAADLLPKALALRGLAGAGMFLGAALLGGLVLGLATGIVLATGSLPVRTTAAARIDSCGAN